MDNIIDLMDNRDFQALAVEKIESELKDFKGDQKGQVVKTYVANTLIEFCQKSSAFAEVVYRTKRTLSDAISDVMKGSGSAISDIEVYRKVAKFYFPNSEVEFQLKITVGEKPDNGYISKESKAEMKPQPKKESSPAKKESASKPKPEPKPQTKKKAPVKKNDEEPEIIQLSIF